MLSVFSVYVFLIRYFLYLHFNCCALSWVPFQKLPISFLLPTTHQPTHFYFPVLAFPYTGASNLLRTKALFSLWCPTRPSSATYVAGAMGPSMCTVCWWLSPWELLGYWLVHIVVPPMGLQTPSAPWVLSLDPPLGTLCSVEWLAESVPLCICHALAEPPRW